MTRVLHRLAQPWARPGSAYSIPGTLVVKLRLGEAPEHLPSLTDVRRNVREQASFLNVEAVDRILKHFTDECWVSRLHSSMSAWEKENDREDGFDDVEHAIGLSRTLHLEVDDECSIANLIDALRQLAIIEEASPQYLCSVPFGSMAQILDPAEARWPREQIHAPEAMAFEPGDATVIVGIVDTGVERHHPELRRRLRSGFNTVDFDKSDLATGIRLVGHWSGPDSDPEDFVGHGTACAGIIGAEGEHIPAGVAGECRLLPIRVLAAALMPGRDEPVGIGAVYDIDIGMKRSIDLGAKVLNLSFGTASSSLEPGDPKPHADIVKYGVARGCVMVAASGNSGKEESFYPAAHDGVIAVGGVDKTGKPCSFSTRGQHVALSSPGEGIVSANLHGYAKASGTSFATPFVTATAALLVSYAEGRAEPVHGGDVKRILLKSAQPFAAGADSKGCGAGILDCRAALRTMEKEFDEKSSAALAVAGGRHG
jgi:subtilisin family serine protease